MFGYDYGMHYTRQFSDARVTLDSRDGPADYVARYLSVIPLENGVTLNAWMKTLDMAVADAPLDPVLQEIFQQAATQWRQCLQDVAEIATGNASPWAAKKVRELDILARPVSMPAHAKQPLPKTSADIPATTQKYQRHCGLTSFQREHIENGPVPAAPKIFEVITHRLLGGLQTYVELQRVLQMHGHIPVMPPLDALEVTSKLANSLPEAVASYRAANAERMRPHWR